MSWFTWLGLAALIAAGAALTGIKPRRTRHVARTRLMGGARLVLLALAVVLVYVSLRLRSGW